MEPILTIDNLNSFGGNMLRQGDKSQLKYRLRDVGNKNLGISGKSCQVKMYGRNYTTVVYETTTTVSSDNSVTFTIDKVLPKGTFYLEFTVGDYIFPTDHREYFEITPSGKAIDANIIEIVGKDVLIREVKSQVDTELQPLVTSLESAEQAEIQRASVEASRVSAEEQRKIDHANRSAELDSKADKVVLKNELIDPSFSNGVDEWSRSVGNTAVAFENEVTVTTGSRAALGLFQDYNEDGLKYISAEFYNDDDSTSFTLGNTILKTTIPNSVWSRVSHVSSESGIIRFYADPGLDHTYKIRKPIIINLTKTFGAGNEPSVEEMDKLIEVTGFIDGEYALSNKEILGRLMRGVHGKADKNQEDWIIPTLLNGWERASPEIKYRKDSIGNVHIVGRVKGGVTSNIFTLPEGYRPSFIFTGQLISNWKPRSFFINLNGTVNLHLPPDDDTSSWVAINVIFPGV